MKTEFTRWLKKDWRQLANRYKPVMAAVQEAEQEKSRFQVYLDYEWVQGQPGQLDKL